MIQEHYQKPDVPRVEWFMGETPKPELTALVREVVEDTWRRLPVSVASLIPTLGTWDRTVWLYYKGDGKPAHVAEGKTAAIPIDGGIVLFIEMTDVFPHPEWRAVLTWIVAHELGHLWWMVVSALAVRGAADVFGDSPLLPLLNICPANPEQTIRVAEIDGVNDARFCAIEERYADATALAWGFSAELAAWLVFMDYKTPQPAEKRERYLWSSEVVNLVKTLRRYNTGHSPNIPTKPVSLPVHKGRR